MRHSSGRVVSLATAVLGLGGLFHPNQSHAAARPDTRPNIVLIVLDDVGFSDIGAFGSEIRTPNIDALARDGLRYVRFDTNAVCSPTRAALLTGRNPQTVHLPDLPAQEPTDDNTKNRGELARNAQTVARVLQDAGYTTIGLGKWHVAPEYEDGTPSNNGSWPLQRGFDRFYGFFLGWTDQYHPNLIEGNSRLPKPVQPGYHFSADIVDRAITALPAASPGVPRKPSFVYMGFGAAHAPIQVPKPYIDAYAGVYDQGWDALRVQRLARMRQMGVVPENTILPPPNSGDRTWNELTPDEKTVHARFMATYAGFLTHADEQIGRLVAHLKATGQYENTLIVLLSDNGAAGEAGQQASFEKLYSPNTLTPAQMLARLDELGSDRTQPEYARPWAAAGVTPFRRYKVWPYLGGVRTPLIVSWPRQVRGAGSIRQQYVNTIDVAPTLVDAAGTHFPTRVNGVAEIPVAGRSIRATFRSAAARTRDVQYFELRANRAITQGRWRAVTVHKIGSDFDTDRWELFDTVADFSESTDLAAKYPRKLDELKQLWWREARKYANPPLGEMPERFRIRETYDGGGDRAPFDRTRVRIDPDDPSRMVVLPEQKD